MTPANVLPIIGRERALLDAFTKALSNAVGGPAPSKATLKQLRLHTAARLFPTHRGNAFEVRIADPDGAPTGHIVRVTVELDRFEEVRRP